MVEDKPEGEQLDVEEFHNEGGEGEGAEGGRSHCELLDVPPVERRWLERAHMHDAVDALQEHAVVVIGVPGH